MKILHVIDSAGLYGAEIMLLNLAEQQKKMGIEPIIASIGEKKIGEKAIEVEAMNRNISVKKFRMASGLNFFGSLKIIKVAQNENINLFHSHGYKGNILLGFIPKSFRKIPIVSTIHGYTSTSFFTKMKVYEILDLLSHRVLDEVVLVNKGMLTNSNLKKYWKTYHVVDNGIPLDPINFSSRDNKNIDARKKLISFCKGKFIIGSIGRLSDEKGFEYLIDALEILISKGVDAYLVIIGDGYNRNKLKQKIHDMKLEQRILLPGYLNDARIYMKYFNIYAIPSLTEGLPITLLEAMQAKVPIVASNVGGIPQVLNKSCAILIPPRKPVLIAEAILKICRNPDLRFDFTVNANRILKQQFSSESMARNYRDIYESILRKSIFN